MSQEEFISKAEKVHADKYDFSYAVYKGSSKNVSVRCIKHDHFFEIQANNLLQGQNCPICRRENQGKTISHNTEIFVNNAISLHGDLYDYSEVDYSLNTFKVKIKCNKHNTFFWQLPSNHLSGHGCPSCAEYGYKKNAPGSLYILKCDNITKVGITNRKVTKRIASINLSSGLDFKEIAHFYFQDGNQPFMLEKIILKHLENNYNNVTQHFDGYTECFYDVNINDLLAFVTPLSQTELEQSSQPILAQ